MPAKWNAISAFRDGQTKSGAFGTVVFAAEH
jgi:hypothetical protein